MPRNEPPADRRPVYRVAVALGTIAAALTVFTLVATVVTYPYTMLVPDRSDEETVFGLLIGFVAMVTTVARLLLVGPKLRLDVILVPAYGVVALLLAYLLGSGAAASWYKLYDFRHRPITSVTAYLRVASLDRTYDKGPHYHLALTGFSPVLDLDADEYHRVAGESRHLAVTGRCVRLHLERSGRAVRIVGPDDLRVVPCPAHAKALHLG